MCAIFGVIGIYDEKKAHQALRQLVQAGFEEVTNASGGFISLERHAGAKGFRNLQISLLTVDKKSLSPESTEDENVVDLTVEQRMVRPDDSPIFIDVRTPEECAAGMYPDAVNIPLDELTSQVENLGEKDRDITLYCASGARSGYGTKVLQRLGFTNVSNGGGIMDMMVKV